MIAAMRRLAGGVLLIAAPAMITAGVAMIVHWADDKTLALAGQITLGLIVGATGLLSATLGIALLRGRL